MITLFKRGQVWWADSNFNGSRQRWSLKTRDRQIAESLKRHSELELLGHGRLTPKLWPEFQKEFLSAAQSHIKPSTLEDYEYVLKRFACYFEAKGLTEVRDVTPAVVASFVESRRKDIHRINHRPMTEGGIRYDLRVLHRAFSYAVDCGYLDRNPVLARNLNATAGRTQPFADSDVAAMLNSTYLDTRPQLRAIVLLFLHTGLRIGDVIRLQRSSITGKTLTLKTQKRETTVRIEIHPAALAALNSIPQHNSRHVFVTSEGRPIWSLDKVLRRFWKHCGVSGGHAHRFRDTFAVKILQAGGSLYDVAKLLGISHRTAELHYTPYVKELQERGARLVRALKFKAK